MSAKKLGVLLCAVTSAGCPLMPNPNPLDDAGETDGEEVDPCSSLPLGAVGALYSFSPSFPVNGPYAEWSATGLPEGLTIDPETGEITGVPVAASTHDDISVSAVSTQTMEPVTYECGTLTINPALDALRVREFPNGCMPVSSSYADLLEQLDGGDGTEVRCIAPVNSSDSCPLGDGNGRLPPGLSLDEATCSYSGEITGERRGTWVWMMAIEQSEYIAWVPYCATSSVDTFHDITLTVDNNNISDLQPGFFEYEPDQPLSLGGGSHHWAIDNPSCPGPDCSNYGFRYNVTCSPFSGTPPWGITLAPSYPSATGFTHEMSASGPAPDPKFDGRAFVASFEISYCTSGSAGYCDTSDSAVFEANAQTKYHYDVIGYPANSNR